ncbi:MAG: PorV/PorQ family protein [Bacteroidetes bacterium]|nr:PorV/PorQ family protein [Bacteroidota bacterium]
MLNIFRTNLLISCLLIMCFAKVSAAEKPTPYSFLSNNLSARTAGLAGATVSFENDIASIYSNPALLGVQPTNSIYLTFLKHLLDINSGNAMYIFNDTTYGKIAASVIYTSYGTFDYYDELGNPLGGSFSGDLIALSGSYANTIAERLYGGVTIKLIYNHIEKMNGIAFAVDGGLFYKLDDERTNIGFSVLNAGTELKKYNNESSYIPLDIKLGFNHRLKGLPLNFNFGFNHLGTSEDNFFKRLGNVNVGGELYIGEYVQLRLGFDNYIRKNLATEQNKGLSGLAFGAGIITSVINVDYAISIYSTDLYLHRLGIYFRF